MTGHAHYHAFRARHHRVRRHAKPTRRQRLTAGLMLLWVLAWVATDAQLALTSRRTPRRGR